MALAAPHRELDVLLLEVDGGVGVHLRVLVHAVDSRWVGVVHDRAQLPLRLLLVLEALVDAEPRRLARRDDGHVAPSGLGRRVDEDDALADLLLDGLDAVLEYALVGVKGLEVEREQGVLDLEERVEAVGRRLVAYVLVGVPRLHAPLEVVGVDAVVVVDPVGEGLAQGDGLVEMLARDVPRGVGRRLRP